VALGIDEVVMLIPLLGFTVRVKPLERVLGGLAESDTVIWKL